MNIVFHLKQNIVMMIHLSTDQNILLTLKAPITTAADDKF